MAPEVGGHAVVVEQRVVDVEEEDDLARVRGAHVDLCFSAAAAAASTSQTSRPSVGATTCAGSARGSRGPSSTRWSIAALSAPATRNRSSAAAFQHDRRDREPPHRDFRHVLRDDPALALLDRVNPGKSDAGVAVVAHAEQHEIEARRRAEELAQLALVCDGRCRPARPRRAGVMRAARDRASLRAIR
jgi:hypothetical protein